MSTEHKPCFVKSNVEDDKKGEKKVVNAKECLVFLFLGGTFVSVRQ